MSRKAKSVLQNNQHYVIQTYLFSAVMINKKAERGFPRPALSLPMSATFYVHGAHLCVAHYPKGGSKV